MKVMGDNFITYEDLPVNQSYKDELTGQGIKIIHELSWFNSVSAYLTDEQITKIKTLPFVKSIEPVKKLYFRKDAPLNNELLKSYASDLLIGYGNSFTQLNLSDVPIVQSKGITGEGVLIGILDSGFDWKEHESLKDRKVIAEYDFVFDDSVTANQSGDIPGQDSHGTKVFSIIGGFKDSVMVGPAFNASYILAKTEDERSETHVEEDNYAAALIWMESYGVDVTTSSLGYNIFDSPEASYTYADMNGNTTIVTKAANLAFERGVTTFTSAGNEGNNKWQYIIAPADGFNMIAVGAVDQTGNKAAFSSIGPTSDGRIKPDVMAMGVNCYGAVAHTTNVYNYGNGTSFAAPIASGIGALVLSAFPHLKNTQVRNIILETSSNSENPNNQIGYGIISAKNAIEYPNLEQINNSFILHKIILEDKIIPSSVKITYGYDDMLFPEEQLSSKTDIEYTFTFPQIIIDKEINFHITYSDSLNNFYRMPETGEYKFIYGTDIISLNLEIVPPVNYDVISDFYPNPFIPGNGKTIKLRFISNGNENFKISIIDGAGQRVIEKNILTKLGENYFEWNGISSLGHLCASGVYYALIQFNGKEYGKKFILLK
jgi:subtilisin family serine protease